MTANMDRFKEAPTTIPKMEPLYNSEQEAERFERKVEADRKLLQYFFRRQAWFSFSALASTKLSLPFSALTRLELIESQKIERRGEGFKAGRKLFA